MPSNKTLALLLLMISPLLTACGPEAVALPGVLDGLLGDLEQRATTVVNNAGAQGRSVTMQAGQEALNAIGALKAAYAASAETTFEGLTDQERRLFEDIQALLTSAESGAADLTDRMSAVTQQVSIVVEELTGRKVPLLQKVSPQFLLPSGGTQVAISMGGMNLATGNPVLRLEGQELEPKQELDNRLHFEVPASLITQAETEARGLQGELTLFERQTQWFVFSKTVPSTYRVALLALPKSIGEYELLAKREVPTTVREERRTGEFRCDSPRGDGSSNVPVHVTPRQGWQIDSSTIQYHRAWSDHGAHTFTSQGAEGFTANLHCDGWGAVWPFDQGSIGVEKGYYSYTEFQPRNESQTQPVKSGALAWGETVLVADLPADTSTVLLNFNPFTGTPTAAQGTDHENRFFILDYNAAAQTAKLTGRSPEEVMGR